MVSEEGGRGGFKSIYEGACELWQWVLNYERCSSQSVAQILPPASLSTVRLRQHGEILLCSQYITCSIRDKIKALEEF